MAWVPPTKHLKTKELVNDKVFYRKLSQKCNFVDDEAVTDWYVGLIKLIGEELRRNKFVRLPHLGDMALVTQRGRPAWAGKMHVQMGPIETLRFYPKQKLRRYCRKVSSE